MIETIINKWGFYYNEGKFDPNCSFNGFWYKNLGNNTFLIICYASNLPKMHLYIFDLFRVSYSPNATIGKSEPMCTKELILGIELDRDKERLDKVFSNPLNITKKDLWED